MKKEWQITSFRDIKKAEDLFALKNKMGDEVYMRCRYVVEEILRTQKAATFLKGNNLPEFGKLMYQSHEGLSKLYQVSCKELDFLVEEAKADKNVIGARLMGGGFGGCTINIIKQDGVTGFLSKTVTAYQKKFQSDPEIIEVEVGDGTTSL